MCRLTKIWAGQSCKSRSNAAFIDIAELCSQQKSRVLIENNFSLRINNQSPVTPKLRDTVTGSFHAPSSQQYSFLLGREQPLHQYVFS
mmetsp:Transcript_126981/g.355636  ORF Transcript_126981/g.355636 Transcript_126981/m.355636 type:complete len:88 (-) Transcript_126981:1385-1648(-)